METVKVDIRKLQMLNDRVAQTIDALNQVRMSVHGIQHTGMQPLAGQYPLQQGQIPLQQLSQPVGFGQLAQVSPLAQQGLAHSTPMFAQMTPGYVPIQSAVGQVLPQPVMPQQIGAAQAFGGWPTQIGISHTSAELDPFWAARAAQSFPYAAQTYPPVSSIF